MVRPPDCDRAPALSAASEESLDIGLATIVESAVRVPALPHAVASAPDASRSSIRRAGCAVRTRSFAVKSFIASVVDVIVRNGPSSATALIHPSSSIGRGGLQMRKRRGGTLGTTSRLRLATRPVARQASRHARPIQSDAVRAVTETTCKGHTAVRHVARNRSTTAQSALTARTAFDCAGHDRMTDDSRVRVNESGGRAIVLT